MQALKKYAAVLVLLLTFPLVRFFANNFIQESDTSSYAYIPQESDFVVEINSRNFISEMAYQRIFNENYFIEKVYPPTEDEEIESRFVETGVDLFERVILFREQWANESIWIAVIKYTDKDAFKNFILEQIPEAHFEFGEEHVIVQLNESADQDKLNEHLQKISKKEIKAFTERVNLADIFDPKKEINCFIIPQTTAHNQLIDGYLSFDFLQDHIAIEGNFTPIHEFNGTEGIAYAGNPDKAFSLRSSLNVFNSLYWFSEEKIEGVPEYDQMAFDYDGVRCCLVHRNMGYSTPFKSFPHVALHFDIMEEDVWTTFFDSLRTQNQIKIDTANQLLVTREGATFNYDLSPEHFQLSQNPFELQPADDPDLYFDLRMNVDAMIDRTVFEVDPENPPSVLEQGIGMAIADEIMNEIRVLANMDEITFQLRKSEENTIAASGRVNMKEANGQSMIESLSFGTAALLFLKNY